MANAVRVRVPPSAPVRKQGLWQVAATLSFFLVSSSAASPACPLFSCLDEFGANRWYKRCRLCHLLLSPLPPLLTRTALAASACPDAPSACHVYIPCGMFGVIDNNVGRWHMFQSGKQAETASLLHGLSLRHDDRQPRERHSRGCLVFTSSLAVCHCMSELPHRRRDYDALLSGCCPCTPLSASSRISATGLNATPRREGPDGASEACSRRAATSSSASFCAASPAGRR